MPPVSNCDSERAVTIDLCVGFAQQSLDSRQVATLGGIKQRGARFCVGKHRVLLAFCFVRVVLCVLFCACCFVRIILRVLFCAFYFVQSVCTRRPINSRTPFRAPIQGTNSVYRFIYSVTRSFETICQLSAASWCARTLQDRTLRRTICTRAREQCTKIRGHRYVLWRVQAP
jgi:hypothetical protein